MSTNSTTTTIDEQRATSIRLAQIILVTELGWYSIGQGFHRTSGKHDELSQAAEQNLIHCTVLDLTTIPDESDDLVAKIIEDCTGSYVGVTDQAGLETALKGMGAKLYPIVRNLEPPCTCSREEGMHEWDCAIMKARRGEK